MELYVIMLIHEDVEPTVMGYVTSEVEAERILKNIISTKQENGEYSTNFYYMRRITPIDQTEIDELTRDKCLELYNEVIEELNDSYCCDRCFKQPIFSASQLLYNIGDDNNKFSSFSYMECDDMTVCYNCSMFPTGIDSLIDSSQKQYKYVNARHILKNCLKMCELK